MELLRQAWAWLDDRTGVSGIFTVLAKHLVPPGTTWWYVFGSATLVAFIVQVVTGIALATAYVTSTGQAYDSLSFITNQALMGRVLRGMHYFGASAMILFIGMHAVRVFLMGSYKFPREMNWLTGSVLLLLTVGMGFTGQLLRWDQNAVWSIVVGAEQAGRAPILGPIIAHFILAGDTVGGATLSRFFAFHVFFIPAVIFGLLGAHLYLVLRHGISEPPQAGRPVDPHTYRAWYSQLLERHGHPFWPDAAWRDVVFGTAVVAGILLLAITFGPPQLGMPPDPSIIRADPRPDWYLLWYFSVLALIPPRTEAYVIIFGPLLFGAVLMLLPFLFQKGERHPLRRPWAIGVIFAIVVMIGTLWREAYKAPWSPNFEARPLPANVVGAADGPVSEGASLFHAKGCLYCHEIEGYGGHRGPSLSDVADRLTRDQMTVRIMNGATNMPAFANNLTPHELQSLLAFLETRRAIQP
jgi:ubiquinol-cytochrome c reductase cytochrome b subunit